MGCKQSGPVKEERQETVAAEQQDAPKEASHHRRRRSRACAVQDDTIAGHEVSSESSANENELASTALSYTDETFAYVDAGASLTYPAVVGTLKKGQHVCLHNHPCRILEIHLSLCGKHGHAKAHMTGVDIFTGKKYEEVSPSSHSLPAPFITTHQYDLIDIADIPDDLTHKFVVSLLDPETCETREDLDLPDDVALSNKIRSAYATGDTVHIQVTSAMGIDQIMYETGEVTTYGKILV